MDGAPLSSLSKTLKHSPKGVQEKDAKKKVVRKEEISRPSNIIYESATKLDGVHTNTGDTSDLRESILSSHHASVCKPTSNVGCDSTKSSTGLDSFQWPPPTSAKRKLSFISSRRSNGIVEQRRHDRLASVVRAVMKRTAVTDQAAAKWSELNGRPKNCLNDDGKDVGMTTSDVCGNGSRSVSPDIVTVKWKPSLVKISPPEEHGRYKRVKIGDQYESVCGEPVNPTVDELSQVYSTQSDQTRDNADVTLDIVSIQSPWREIFKSEPRMDSSQPDSPPPSVQSASSHEFGSQPESGTLDDTGVASVAPDDDMSMSDVSVEEVVDDLKVDVEEDVTFTPVDDGKF